jgi:hypothetical protein
VAVELQQLTSEIQPDTEHEAHALRRLRTAADAVVRGAQVQDAVRTKLQQRMAARRAPIETIVEVARIQISARAEIRIATKNVDGRVFVDVRVWRRKRDQEWKSTMRAVTTDPETLPVLIEALSKARQHVPTA